MSLIRCNLKCPASQVVIERNHRHRFRLIERLVFEGRPCVSVSPLDKGFQDYATAIWPQDWVYFHGQQLELFCCDHFARQNDKLTDAGTKTP